MLKRLSQIMEEEEEHEDEECWLEQLHYKLSKLKVRIVYLDSMGQTGYFLMFKTSLC